MTKPWNFHGRVYGSLAIIVLMILAVAHVTIFSVDSSYSVDLDVYGVVTYVVDGDTVDIEVLNVYDLKYSDLLSKVVRVRFADINAPELDTLEGRLARDFLYNLTFGEYVYLDIDDLYVYDKYGRVVATLYLPTYKHYTYIKRKLIPGS